MTQPIESIPTLSYGENESELTKDRVMEILQPYEEALTMLSGEENKKKWLVGKRPELTGQMLDEAHASLTKYAEEQLMGSGLGEEAPDILKTYYYVHGLIRYNIV